MAETNQLPKTMKALVLTSRDQPLTVETVPTPQPTIGSAIVRILTAKIISYTREVYSGKRPYPFPTPIVPGTSAVGRVAAVGPDATKLKTGDLVYIDTTVRSRDDPTDVYLAAVHEGFTPGSAKLMKDVYRDWSYAEYCRAPLENLTLINEAKLVGSPSAACRGYKIDQLASVSGMLVPYGGLRDIELKAGQTVIVAPATGPFGGAAVIIALAMGARVIAMGRNKDSLANIKKLAPHPDRVETVPITGDMEADCKELKKYGPIDAYFDFGPPEAHASTHIKSCILALRHGARVSLMGGYRTGESGQDHNIQPL
jgi:threonine dehydrogenase-like Zn-dependent dehydrogenase